jgi:hypothetical protein
MVPLEINWSGFAFVAIERASRDAGNPLTVNDEFAIAKN